MKINEKHPQPIILADMKEEARWMWVLYYCD